ncbi:MAG TPA: NapC/NirT family cytochrome c [Terracidiphilus sp.]|nr:NapC/NirT family cytochrome c [Terracidiphilus sp.]
MFERFRENWLRPALFFGNNPISLLGGAVTTAAAVMMLGYWVYDLFQEGASNPYLGIIFFLILPFLFLLGLAIIPVGIFFRRRTLLKSGQVPSVFPLIDFNDRIFRHGVDIVILATMVNLLVVSIASYRGAQYMGSPQFCGKSCHVMNPEYTAYQVSTHSHVACADCHIGPGAQSFFEAKINGTRQLVEVTLGNYPRPIPSPVRNLRSARYICASCHAPTRFYGDKLLVKTSFGDDEKNSETQTVLLLHVGGEDAASRFTGIHGAHLGHIEYIATDPGRQTIPWVQKRNPDGTETVFAASTLNGKMPAGQLRTMDCIDCHNRAAHSFITPEEALNRAMAEGVISPSLPYIHKEGLVLLKTAFSSQEEARAQIPAQLEAYYRTQNPQVLAAHADLVRAAGNQLVTLYAQNVFPDMKVTWGTHPNDIGHTAYPGCFRCHDGDHTAKGGQSISQDCSVCHNILATDEAKPKVLADLGLQ